MPAGMIKLYRGKSKKRFTKRRRLPFSRNQTKAIRKIAQKSGEKKVFEMAEDTTAFSTVAKQLDIATDFRVAHGDDSNQRDGNSIRLSNLHWRVQLDSPSTTSDVYQVLVVQFLEKEEPVGLTALKPHDLLPRLETAEYKYKVLYKRMIHINPGGGSSNLSKYKVFDIKIPAKRLPIKTISYEDGDTLGSLINSGNIKLYINNISNVSTSVVINGRLTYYDS